MRTLGALARPVSRRSALRSTARGRTATNRTPRPAGRGRGNAPHSWACSGFTSQSRTSTGAVSPRASRRSKTLRKPAILRGRSRAPRESGSTELRRRCRREAPRTFGLPERQRAFGRVASRKTTSAPLLDGRSKRAARRETSRSRTPGFRPRGLEVIPGCSLTSWVSTSSLDASRLASSVRSTRRDTPRSGRARSHAAHGETAGVRCRAPHPSIDSTRMGLQPLGNQRDEPKDETPVGVPHPAVNNGRVGARPGQPSERAPSGARSPSPPWSSAKGARLPARASDFGTTGSGLPQPTAQQVRGVLARRRST